MDLDDEELKATRRMNGSDKNVGSIEEIIEIVERMVENCKEHFEFYGEAFVSKEEIKALEHLIKAYKEKEQIEEEHKKINGELRERVKELEEENEFLKLKEKNRVLGRYGEIEVHELINKTLANDYIPISLVEEKIEELKSKSGGNLFHIQQTINAEIRLLQELLEKRKYE